MARKLPWERAASRPRVSASTQRRSFSPARAGPSRRNGDDGNDGDDRRNRRKHTGPPSVPNSATQFRTPSTSPPPAPPPEAFMVDGLENDDKYRMVEDELLAVAQSYTAHLHAAEYQRLKAKAKQQAKATGGSGLLPRPVTGAPTDRVKKRGALAEQRTKQKRVLKALQTLDGRLGDDDTSDDADAPWAGTSLHKLMEGSPRKAKPALVSLGHSASTGKESEMSRLKYRPLTGSSPLKTVTSVGMSAGQTASDGDEDEDEDEDDLDDLDGPPEKKKKTQPKRNWPSAARAETSRPQPSRITQTSPPRRTVSFAPIIREIPPSHHSATPYRDDFDLGHDDEDEDDEISDLDSGSLMDKIRRRREQDKAERQRRQQQQREARRAG